MGKTIFRISLPSKLYIDNVNEINNNREIIEYFSSNRDTMLLYKYLDNYVYIVQHNLENYYIKYPISQNLDYKSIVQFDIDYRLKDIGNAIINTMIASAEELNKNADNPIIKLNPITIEYIYNRISDIIKKISRASNVWNNTRIIETINNPIQFISLFSTDITPPLLINDSIIDNCQFKKFLSSKIGRYAQIDYLYRRAYLSIYGTIPMYLYDFTIFYKVLDKLNEIQDKNRILNFMYRVNKYHNYKNSEKTYIKKIIDRHINSEILSFKGLMSKELEKIPEIQQYFISLSLIDALLNKQEINPINIEELANKKYLDWKENSKIFTVNKNTEEFDSTIITEFIDNLNIGIISKKIKLRKNYKMDKKIKIDIQAWENITEELKKLIMIQNRTLIYFFKNNNYNNIVIANNNTVGYTSQYNNWEVNILSTDKFNPNILHDKIFSKTRINAILSEIKPDKNMKNDTSQNDIIPIKLILTIIGPTYENYNKTITIADFGISLLLDSIRKKLIKSNKKLSKNMPEINTISFSRTIEILFDINTPHNKYLEKIGVNTSELLFYFIALRHELIHKQLLEISKNQKYKIEIPSLYQLINSILYYTRKDLPISVIQYIDKINLSEWISSRKSAILQKLSEIRTRINIMQKQNKLVQNSEYVVVFNMLHALNSRLITDQLTISAGVTLFDNEKTSIYVINKLKGLTGLEDTIIEKHFKPIIDELMKIQSSNSWF